LFSVYIADANFPAATAAMKTAALPLLVTELGEFELLNAVGLRLFRKELKAGEAAAALGLFHKDIDTGIVRLFPLSSATFERARQLAGKHTPRMGTRALDVLHVASALALHADTFYTFDRNQARLAPILGLRVPS
jgi:predicted nucleic acid-binding protein